MKQFLMILILGLAGIAQASRVVDYDLTKPLAVDQQKTLSSDLATVLNELNQCPAESRATFLFGNAVQGLKISINRNQSAVFTLKVAGEYPAPSFQHYAGIITIQRTPEPGSFVPDRGTTFRYECVERFIEAN